MNINSKHICEGDYIILLWLLRAVASNKYCFLFILIVEERERTNNLQEDIVRISQEHAHKIDTLIAEHKKNITAMEDRLIQIRKEEITKREFCYLNHNP